MLPGLIIGTIWTLPFSFGAAVSLLGERALIGVAHVDWVGWCGGLGAGLISMRA